MKKIVFLCTMLMCIAIILILGACTSSPNNLPSILDDKESIIGVDGVPVPGWVQNIPVEEDAVYFVGIGGGKDLTKAEKQILALLDVAKQFFSWKFTVSSQHYWEELSFKDAVAFFMLYQGLDFLDLNLHMPIISEQESIELFLSQYFCKMNFVDSWIDNDGNFLVLVIVKSNEDISKHYMDSTQENGLSEKSDEKLNINKGKQDFRIYEEISTDKEKESEIYKEFRPEEINKAVETYKEFKVDEILKAEVLERQKSAMDKNIK